MSAHVCASPAVTAVTSPARPVTAVGRPRSMFVPSPIWPDALLPQHCTVASVRTAHGVLVTGVDRRDRAIEIMYGDRCDNGCRSARAELPREIVAPAVQSAVSSYGACTA